MVFVVVRRAIAAIVPKICRMGIEVTIALYKRKRACSLNAAHGRTHAAHRHIQHTYHAGSAKATCEPNLNSSSDIARFGMWDIPEDIKIVSRDSWRVK